MPWVENQTTHLQERLNEGSIGQRIIANQTGWDSVFYLSIAVEGYDGTLTPQVQADDGSFISTNYAFYPLYPFLIRFIAGFLSPTGINPYSLAAGVGVFISLLGTLAGMLSLHSITEEVMGKDTAWRTAFYLLIFPSAFFLAQVYTEGLFIGLAFTSLALLHKHRFFWAGISGALAILTRATGILLIPVFIFSLYLNRNQPQPDDIRFNSFVNTLVLFAAPSLAFLFWWLNFSEKFFFIEESFFYFGFNTIKEILVNWRETFLYATRWGPPESLVYYILEIASLLLALLSCSLMARRFPLESLFGFLVVVLMLISGPIQGFIRFTLVVPATPLMLASAGRKPVFDRAWTFFSMLLFGLMTTLFTFDMWIG